MAVKMRLMRMGKKKSAAYRVVVIDGRAPRDGRYIDLIGRYDPRQDPSLVEIDQEKAIDWLRKGAQPTESVRKILEISGALSRFKVASGKIHTVPTAPAGDASAGDEASGDEASGDEASGNEASGDDAGAAEETTTAGAETSADTDGTPDPAVEEAGTAEESAAAGEEE